MSARLGFWLAGLATGVLAGSAVPESLFAGVRPVAFGTGFLLVGLSGELLDWSLSRSREANRAGARDARPADGRIDLAAVAGVRREPNAIDPRFGRYLGRAPGGSKVGPTVRKTRPPDDRRRNPPLLGRVVVVSCFVGRDGRRWTDREVAEAHKVLTRAGAWVEREAKAHSAPVNVELADTYFVLDEKPTDEPVVNFTSAEYRAPPIEAEADYKAVVGMTRGVVRLGFRDALDLFRDIESRLEADAVVWLVHPKQAGCSFAIPREDTDLSGSNVAVCYARESLFPEPLRGAARVDPVTVVHELLHLFGATDKYDRSLKSFPRKTVSARDVMRLSQSRLARFRIDAGTASEIGWSSTPLQNATAGASS